MTHDLESFMVDPGSIPMLHVAPTPMRRQSLEFLRPKRAERIGRDNGVGAHSLAKDDLLRDIMKHPGLNPVRSGSG
jgi:hypothetical protein